MTLRIWHLTSGCVGSLEGIQSKGAITKMMKGRGLIYGGSCKELCTVIEKGGSDKAVQIFVGVKS